MLYSWLYSHQGHVMPFVPLSVILTLIIWIMECLLGIFPLWSYWVFSFCIINGSSVHRLYFLEGDGMYLIQACNKLLDIAVQHLASIHPINKGNPRNCSEVLRSWFLRMWKGVLTNQMRAGGADVWDHTRALGKGWSIYINDFEMLYLLCCLARKK